VRKLGQHAQKQILSIGLIIVLTGVFSVACAGRKVVRVTVTEQDVLRANEASQEGDLAFGRKDYYAALIKYLEAVRLNPNNDNMYNRLGIIYSQLKLYEDARQAFEHALALKPKFAYAVNNLGSVYFAQGNLKKAEKFFKKAIHLKTDEASFHMNLGSIYLERQKIDDAMVEFRKSLALDPDILSKNSAVILPGSGSSESPMKRFYFLARLYASAGNVEPAIENLKQAISNGFSDVEAIEKQHDFDSIRQDERFVKFMQEIALLIRLRSNVGLPANTK